MSQIVSTGIALSDPSTGRYSLRVSLNWEGNPPQTINTFPLVPGFNGLSDSIDVQSIVQGIATFKLRSVYGSIQWHTATIVAYPDGPGALFLYFSDSQFCPLISSNIPQASATQFGASGFRYNSFCSPLITSSTRVSILKMADGDDTMRGQAVLFFNSFDLGTGLFGPSF